jgi:methionyl-tRNA formyltransferase
MKDLRIIFMGTPEFAVASLNMLIKNKFNIVGVITAPDKPAGRGKKINQSAIKQYALDNNLNILQPRNLKDPKFLNELKQLNANLQIVVAFRMLPEQVWNMPEFGTFNLHASLLPQYRGAAPINWTIINGENETGVTTFFLDHKIDTGKIIESVAVNIKKEETAGELHDRLMEVGSKLVLNTTKSIAEESVNTINQEEHITKETKLKHAPKLNNETCRINWKADGNTIYNLIRGLSPYPAAYTILSISGKELKLKIFKSHIEPKYSNSDIGHIETDQKTFIKIKCEGAWVYPEEIQLAGKKKMSTPNFLRGFNLKDTRIIT